MLILSEGNFFRHFCSISMYSVLNKLSEYVYFYILKKHYFIHCCCSFLKSPKAFKKNKDSFSTTEVLITNQ